MTFFLDEGLIGGLNSSFRDERGVIEEKLVLAGYRENIAPTEISQVCRLQAETNRYH